MVYLPCSWGLYQTHPGTCWSWVLRPTLPDTGLYTSVHQLRPELMFRILANIFGSRPNLRTQKSANVSGEYYISRWSNSISSAPKHGTTRTSESWSIGGVFLNTPQLPVGCESVSMIKHKPPPLHPHLPPPLPLPSHDILTLFPCSLFLLFQSC